MCNVKSEEKEEEKRCSQNVHEVLGLFTRFLSFLGITNVKDVVKFFQKHKLTNTCKNVHEEILVRHLNV